MFDMIQVFFDFLNRNSGAFAVLFGAVVAGATLVYARLTAALVAETNRMRRAQTEPEVIVSIQSSEVWINLIELVVENIGAGSAYNLRLDVDPDVKCSRGQMLSSIGLFKHGMRQLGPRRSVKTFLFSVTQKGEGQDPLDGQFRFAVNARYDSSSGESAARRFELDLLHLVGMVQLGTPPLKTISDSLKELQRDVHHLATGFNRLGVNVHTKAEVDAEYAERLEDFARQKAEHQEGS